MSGVEVIGAISAVTSIVDASIKIYESAQKDLKLSETFKVVGRRLPIILDTLQTCKSHLQPIRDSLPAEPWRRSSKHAMKKRENQDKFSKRFYLEKMMGGRNDM
jgi:hypothetical protein